MEYPASHYLDWTGYGLRIVGTRVDIDIILIDFLHKKMAIEEISAALPTVPLSHIYGAIAYYYEHQALMDEYLAEGDRFVDSQPPLSQTNPDLYARLEAARKRIHQKTA